MRIKVDPTLRIRSITSSCSFMLPSISDRRLANLALDREETPVAGYALQVLSPPILERQPRARDEVSDRRRDKHFAGLGQRGDPGSDMHGNSAKLVPHDFALAGMEARPDLESERPYVVRDGAGAAHCAGRAVERGEKAIPGGIDLATAEAGELAAD